LIEPEDLFLPGDGPIHNRSAISAPGTLDRATAETIAVRLAELRSEPVPGVFDSIHLQQIHAHIFQDLFPWAGQFRAPESSSSLDTLFDRLARENRLKGLDLDVWSKRSTDYFTEIAAIEPFVRGTELVSLEFFRELASENNLTLRWPNAMSEPSHEEMQSQLQRTQSNNLRRILMLTAVPEVSRGQASPDLDRRHALQLTDPSLGFL
jgi:cell filamentation protein